MIYRITGGSGDTSINGIPILAYSLYNNQIIYYKEGGGRQVVDTEGKKVFVNGRLREKF